MSVAEAESPPRIAEDLNPTAEVVGKIEPRSVEPWNWILEKEKSYAGVNERFDATLRSEIELKSDRRESSSKNVSASEGNRNRKTTVNENRVNIRVRQHGDWSRVEGILEGNLIVCVENPSVAQTDGAEPRATSVARQRGIEVISEPQVRVVNRPRRIVWSTTTPETKFVHPSL
jgi:hypothetical protein